ncbi:hypothetical protein [Corynebacterium nasicanis]|uniref:Uncharacterized protein n=1 Tax=Corynebacterium nasicanis TaxID=1448267 RepID=A0ABW1QDT0_9CORY
MDAGPGLTFFSARQERLLFQIVGAVSIPQIVEEEILGKASRDTRFQPAASVLGKLPDKLLHVLPDTQTEELGEVIYRIRGKGIELHHLPKKDLGETMVIAHAVVRAEAGTDVIILIDEAAGTRIAHRESARLERMRSANGGCGTLRLLSTMDILTVGAHRGLIADRGHMRRLYEQFRTLDDGLVHIDNTRLLSRELWGFA